jgi:Mg-chelatase subunit ChlD
MLKNSTRLGLRSVVLGLLVLAWWNPALPWQQAPRDVIVLLDDSLSMERTAVASAWSWLVEGMAAAPAGSRFALIRFAAAPVLEVPLTDSKAFPAALPPRLQPLDRSASDLEAALAFGLRLADPRRSPAVVLLSDGAETQGHAQTALHSAQSAALPVYGIAPAPAAKPAVWIANLELPTRARLGQRVLVAVTLAGALTGTGSLQLRVNGVLQADQPVTLEAGKKTVISFWCEPPVAGPNRLEVTLAIPGDAAAENDTRAAILNVAGPGPVLYLTAEVSTPPAADSLRRGGWPVRVIHPQVFLQQELQNAAVIILDDIAVTDMEEHAWLSLAQAVRTQGSGLIVLGGPRSLGGGGYRHSTLETLLPVIAEGAKPQPPAAVLFVVDKSGSMDQAEAGISRLALARRAVTETASSLLDSDRIGLLAFDVQPRVLVPLGTYQHPGRVLDAAWQLRAAGGTRLRPALQAALEQLQAAQTEQRLLVLVTDGFVEGEDFADIEPQLAAGKVTVIALAVGDADPTVLQRLARYNDGKLLRVRELATLPRLMHQEVGKKRLAMETGAVIPQQIKPLPYILDDAWPALQAYMVTKARPGASVYLQSPEGDPLLALQQTGAGRVLILPGGLGAWANAWLQWPAFGRLLGGLLEWVDSRTGDPLLELYLQDKPGALDFSIDALGEDQDWNSAPDVGLTLRDPADRLLDITPELTAPGRYVATVPVQQPGQYRATVRVGSHVVQQDILHRAYDEFTPPTTGSQVWASWLAQGLLQPWSKDSLTGRTAAPTSLYPRTVLLVLAGLVYLGLLVAERGLLAVLVRSPFLH